MNEKIYKTMNTTGALNLVLGIVAITVGLTTGVLLIIHAVKLWKARAAMLI